MKLISLTNLTKTVGKDENSLTVLSGISLDIVQGEFLAIKGQSGSGKSTLMNILGCLDTPTSGSYTIEGAEITAMSPEELADLRNRKFGFIFQRYNLLGSLSAVDNVALPAVYAGLPDPERKERAASLLRSLGLETKLRSRPNELSGGQQQRTSIARALMNGGEIILADEPTGALDSHSGEMVMRILSDLNASGHTVILVTHDDKIAAYADRTIEIRDGQIIHDDHAEKSKPVAPSFTQAPVPLKGLSFYSSQLIESFRMSVQAVLDHKLRSLLTMLGIIIGIASVVTAIAIGRGSQEKIIAGISSIGTNTIDIYPGSGFGDMQAYRVRTLSVEDSELLGRQRYLAGASPVVIASGVMVFRNISVSVLANGVGDEYFDVRGIRLSEGRLLMPQDLRDNASVAVIDPLTRERLFQAGENPLGQIIIMNKKPLEVIGVTQAQGSRFDTGGNLSIWIPYTTLMHKISGARDITSVVVKVRDDVTSQMAEKNLTELLTVRHEGKQDFFTFNSDSIRQTVESTAGTMTLLISCIALISLVVGGIGIMNIMLVSVTERTTEIGLRMAIGARQGSILAQFLIEAVLLCLLGGLLGLGVSFLVGLFFEWFVQAFPLSFSTGSIVLALICSTGIGVLFGFMPARNASRLDPIAALARD